jgi:hypothetical protein
MTYAELEIAAACAALRGQPAPGRDRHEARASFRSDRAPAPHTNDEA